MKLLTKDEKKQCRLVLLVLNRDGETKVGDLLRFLRHRIGMNIILISMMLVAFCWVSPSVAAEETLSADTALNGITVDMAYNMIADDSFPDLIILDVRYQSEYRLGHLYDAVLIPYDELEIRIGEFNEHKNQEIIVYCGSGYRSQIASEILVEYNFTRVYNMLGGVLAWIEAGYPFFATSHYATVNIVDEEVQVQIEPFLLHQTGCISCAQNQTCPSGNPLINITSTVLEQEENHTVVLLTYEVNGTEFEMTVARTLLWSYEELTNEINRTASFISTEITGEAISMQFYGLSYLVQHEKYDFTVNTNLMPLNSETYNSSFTNMNYAPPGKFEVTSLEFVEFNSSVTLSQQYAVLGKVAKEIGKVYEKSGSETLAQLAVGYCTMEEELKYLSKLVEKQLQEYNKPIRTLSATLHDGFWECLICEVGCTLALMIGCLGACAVYPLFCPVCLIVLEFVFELSLACGAACAWGGCWDWVWF